MTVADHIDLAAVNDQVAITHTQYGSGNKSVAAGTKTGFITAITAVDVSISTAIRGAATFTIPRANITDWQAGRGWRNA